MKKIIAKALLIAGFCLVATTAANASSIKLNTEPTLQDKIDFGPSNQVVLEYIAGNNGVEIASGDEPQQYVALSKHTGGTRVFVTTESSNLFTTEYDDWRGLTLMDDTLEANDQSISFGANNANDFLGYNIKDFTDGGWQAL